MFLRKVTDHASSASDKYSMDVIPVLGNGKPGQPAAMALYSAGRLTRSVGYQDEASIPRRTNTASLATAGW
ncbi:Cilia- and flagella-associated protein [Trichinella pseudospiralis]